MVDQSLFKTPLSGRESSSANSLPFSGLGFDLTAICVAGATCRLVEIRHEASAVDVYFYSSRSAGYALLVELGREIRGR